jgi:hypothetical protein
MACGHDICPDTRCGVRFALNGGARFRCNRIKGCQEAFCNDLKVVGPNGFVLYDMCLGHCHDDGSPKYPPKYRNTNEYLCANADPQTLIEYFGVNPCLVSEDGTKIDLQNKAYEQSNKQAITFLIVIVAIIIALVMMVRSK